MTTAVKTTRGRSLPVAACRGAQQLRDGKRLDFHCYQYSPQDENIAHLFSILLAPIVHEAGYWNDTEPSAGGRRRSNMRVSQDKR